MSRKPKVNFTTEEAVQLTGLFDTGLDSVSKEKAEAIRDVAQKLNKTEQEIRNWIGNERSRRKRSSKSSNTTSTVNPVKKAPQKLRAPNPYNLFVQDFFKSTEGKSISSLGEKNRVASSKWRCMEPEDKNRYQQIARQVSVDLTPDVAVTHYDKLHEARRVVAKIQENCDWAAKFGVHIYYMACVDKNHFAGGMERGYQFLSDNAHIVGSFITSTKPGITPAVPVPGTKQELRNHVEDSLNLKYALAIREPNARVPYSLLKAKNVIGLPTGVLLKHPSHLKQDELQAVYTALPSIKFIDVPPVMHHVEHSYARAHHDIAGHHDDYLQPYVSGSTTLTSTDNTVQFKTITVKEGNDVHILDQNNIPIGTATIMAGNKLHGNDLPAGFVKITIKDISTSTSVTPWPQIVSSFDDDEVLINGSITGWPQKKLAILT